MSFLNDFAIYLAAGVGLILLYLLWLALRRGIVVKLGLRNIPRRPLQSLLIVVGLTLSTVIIISSLSTGDTLTFSVRKQAVSAYGKIDEIIAPPLLSALAALAEGSEEGAATDESQQELEQLFEGGLSSVLVILEGGLPGISTERYAQLRAEAEQEPLIDAVAGSIIFPTIIRNVTSGQGEPLGFIFAVDSNYDQEFGLTAVDGEAVAIDSLQPGVGNIFSQASNLFGLVQRAGAWFGLDDFSISDVALATAAIGAILTQGSAEGVDLAAIDVDLQTLRNLGVDTTTLEEQGIESLSLDNLGITPERLQAAGVPTTTLSLSIPGVDATGIQTTTANLLGAINLNTLGAEIDRVLAPAGLQLRQGDVYLNRLGAERLDARTGDVLEVFIGPIPIPFRVKAIVNEAGPLGALTPVVMLRLDEAQKLLFMQGKVNNILVSNQGDELAGMEHTDAVSERLRVLALDPAAVQSVTDVLQRSAARSAVDAAAPNAARDLFGEFDGPPFLRDLFAGIAGVEGAQALIAALPAALDGPAAASHVRELLANRQARDWLLGLSLPAADRDELAQALARLDQFDLLDPLSKSSVVTVANVGGALFSSVFSLFGVFSILAGVILIFLIFVMLAAERRSEIGMARAVGMQRSHIVQMFVAEGMVYDLAAAALGVALGLAVSYTMVGFLGGLFGSVTQQLGNQSDLFQITFHVAPTSVVIAYCAGVIFTFVVVMVAARRVSRVNIVTAMRDLPERTAGLARTAAGRIWQLAVGPLLIGLGVYLLGGWWLSGQAITLLGITFTAVGLSLLASALLLRTNLRPERVQRWVYTAIGLALLAIWGIPWSRWLGDGSADLDPGSVLLTFGLTGPLLILGAILVIMFNADAWTWAISRLLGGIGPLTPVLKTAIAYPLSARFRTGVAMLLFAMVITTVTLMSVVIEATQTIVAPDGERYAGFEIGTSFSLLSFFDPMEDLATAIAADPAFPADQVAAVGTVMETYAQGRQLGADQPDAAEWGAVRIAGVDGGYLDQAEQVYRFALRAPGYATDAAVWQALRQRSDVAVLARGTAPDAGDGEDSAPTVLGVPITMGPEEGGGGVDGERRRREDGPWRGPLRFSGFTADDAELPELRVALQPFDGQAISTTVQIIGVLEQRTTLAGDGIQANRRLLDTLAGEPVTPDTYYVKVSPGADVHAVARALERAFLSNSLDTSVLAESFAAGQAVTRGILQLFQGFLALGLLVGIAALGVISARTVVERRQQVGMLRAIGYQQNMVALSFVLESSFIALTGIAIGTVTGVLLGQTMVRQLFDVIASDVSVSTPWLQIAGIVVVAYLFSLLTTLLPAYQASRIYPAEALRYE